MTTKTENAILQAFTSKCTQFNPALENVATKLLDSFRENLEDAWTKHMSNDGSEHLRSWLYSLTLRALFVTLNEAVVVFNHAAGCFSMAITHDTNPCMYEFRRFATSIARRRTIELDKRNPHRTVHVFMPPYTICVCGHACHCISSNQYFGLADYNCHKAINDRVLSKQVTNHLPFGTTRLRVVIIILKTCMLKLECEKWARGYYFSDRFDPQAPKRLDCDRSLRELAAHQVFSSADLREQYLRRELDLLEAIGADYASRIAVEKAAISRKRPRLEIDSNDDEIVQFHVPMHGIELSVPYSAIKYARNERKKQRVIAESFKSEEEEKEHVICD